SYAAKMLDAALLQASAPWSRSIVGVRAAMRRSRSQRGTTRDSRPAQILTLPLQPGCPRRAPVKPLLTAGRQALTTVSTAFSSPRLPSLSRGQLGAVHQNFVLTSR